MSLITCGSIHEGHEWFSDDSRGRQEIFMCLAALILCEQFSGSYFMRSFFFSMYSAAVKCWAKLLPFGVNCRLQLAGLGKKREETMKPTCFMSKASSVPQTPETNHSQKSSHVEALNLMVKSKSQSVAIIT